MAPKPLTTVSYVFDELTECDERQYIESVKEQYGIHSVQVLCDDAWTFKDWENWPSDPNRPGGSFYRMILEHVYERAHDEDLRVLLTGYMGDHLYSAGGDWIADLILDRQFLRAAQELIFQIKNAGWKRTLRIGHIRRTARRVVDSIHPGAIRFPRRNSPPDWIDPAFKEFFTRNNKMNPGFERHGTLLGVDASSDIAHAFRSTNRHQIELRNPFRDRRLIEFILAIPAYQLYCHGISRYILRNAMQDILPETIRTRSTKTSFISVYHRGVERERELHRVLYQ